MIPYKFYFYDDTDVTFLPKGLKGVYVLLLNCTDKIDT